MAAPEPTSLRSIPNEILIKILQSIPTPVSLLNILNAFPTIQPLFRKYHRTILDKVLSVEVAPSIEAIRGNLKPKDRIDAACTERIHSNPNTCLFEVPRLRRPMATLRVLVQGFTLDSWERQRIAGGLGDPGARSLLFSYHRYWRMYVALEEVRVFLKQLPRLEAERGLSARIGL